MVVQHRLPVDRHFALQPRCRLGIVAATMVAFCVGFWLAAVLALRCTSCLSGHLVQTASLCAARLMTLINDECGGLTVLAGDLQFRFLKFHKR